MTQEELKQRLIELLNETFSEQYEKRGLLTAPHTAEALIANGVTIRERGEWRFGTQNGQKGYYCTKCGAGFAHSPNAEWIAKSHKFCPECGADMRGWKDEKGTQRNHRE